MINRIHLIMETKKNEGFRTQWTKARKYYKIRELKQDGVWTVNDTWSCNVIRELKQDGARLSEQWSGIETREQKEGWTGIERNNN